MQCSRECLNFILRLSEWIASPLISVPTSDPPTCQAHTQVLYTVALNTSVVLSCEMAAHPGGEEITFSWSGNTSLITRHVDNMAASRKQSDTRVSLYCPDQGFCQSCSHLAQSTIYSVIPVSTL